MFGLFKKKKSPEATPQPHPQRVDDRFKNPPPLVSRQLPTDVQPKREDSDENFALSMAVGMATDNAVLGYAVGGSLVGGLLGAELSQSPPPEPVLISCDSSGSLDTGSSYDSGSSFDRGSCGGSDSGSW